MSYGLKEYKALLEKNLIDLRNPMSTPFGCDPHSDLSITVRYAKMESINYALEMLPEIKEPKVPMKDHEFREQVNELLELVKTYGHTQQLRTHLRSFLYQFKEKCE
jgi:hypothetical protein